MPSEAMAMSTALTVTKARPTLTWTVMAREIINDITCKFDAKLVAMEVKADPESETNCIPLSHLREQSKRACPDTNPDSLRHMIVAFYKPTDGSCCLLTTSTETRSFILWDTMSWTGRKPRSWSVMLQQLGLTLWRPFARTKPQNQKASSICF